MRSVGIHDAVGTPEPFKKCRQNQGKTTAVSLNHGLRGIARTGNSLSMWARTVPKFSSCDSCYID